MKVSRKTVLLAILGSTLVVAAGCGSSHTTSTAPNAATSTGSAPASGGGSPAQGRTYAFANYTDVNPVLKATSDGYQSLAGKLGISFKRYDNKADPTNTLAVARLMAQAKPTLAIDWAIQPQLTTSLGLVFKRANVPCIALSAPIDGCAYFLLDNAAIGAQEAKAAIPIAKSRGWNGSNTTVVMVTIPGGGNDLNGQPRGFYSAFAQAFPGMQKVSGPTGISDKDVKIGNFSGYQVGGGDSLEHSYDAVKSALQVIPQDRNLVLVALNDDAARGGLRAIAQAGRDGKTMVVGQGADAPSLAALRKGGPWAVEGDPSLKLWSAYSFALADAVLAKAPGIPDKVLAPTAVLTTDNVDRYYDGTTPKTAPPVPPEDAMLKQFHLDQYVKAALTP